MKRGGITGVFPSLTVSTITTAGATTYTTAQLTGGLMLRNPNGASRTDTLPAAALLVATLFRPHSDTSIAFVIRNTAGAAETITVAMGTGGTASGTMTIAQNNSKLFVIRLDTTTSGSEAYTCYSVGTFVH